MSEESGFYVDGQIAPVSWDPVRSEAWSLGMMGNNSRALVITGDPFFVNAATLRNYLNRFGWEYHFGEYSTWYTGPIRNASMEVIFRCYRGQAESAIDKLRKEDPKLVQVYYGRDPSDLIQNG